VNGLNRRMRARRHHGGRCAVQDTMSPEFVNTEAVHQGVGNAAGDRRTGRCNRVVANRSRVFVQGTPSR
jgi:hypothetical protein